MLANTISPEQSAFVEGCQIMDGSLVANEVVEDVLSRKGKGILLKLDFEKAYDRVCWDFLDRVLEAKGFGSRWRRWIGGCLRSMSFAVIVNGCPRS